MLVDIINFHPDNMLEVITGEEISITTRTLPDILAYLTKLGISIDKEYECSGTVVISSRLYCKWFQVLPNIPPRKYGRRLMLRYI